MNDPIKTLEFVNSVLNDLRFSGTDQNPKGIRDLLFAATRQAKTELESLRRSATTIIIGQECIVPKYGLGRVIGWDLDLPKPFIEVRLYLDNRTMQFDWANVKLIPLLAAIPATSVTFSPIVWRVLNKN